MWQRFTERARRMVFYAQEEAGRLGESYVSTEHLLLGMLRENDSVAVRILHQMGISLQQIRGAVEQKVTPGEGRSGQDMQLTPRSKQAIDFAYDEARQLNNNYIGTEHILLGLLREEEGLAGQILRGLGVKLEQARREIKVLQESKSAASPEETMELSSLRENLHKVAEALKNRAQGKREGESSLQEANAPSENGGQRGDVGVLKNADERAVVEFVPAEADLAAFEDVMRIKDEYAYRELVTSGKILLLQAGMPAKLLKRGTGTTDYVRILDGKLAGELGYVLRANLHDLKPDNRPFPPPMPD